jgi:hypothetical protein
VVDQEGIEPSAPFGFWERLLPAWPVENANAALSRGGVLLSDSLHFALLAAAARIGVVHARKQPVARGRDVDKNSIPDPGVRQAVWLVQPTADSAGIAINFGGERLKIEVVSEKIRF